VASGYAIARAVNRSGGPGTVDFGDDDVDSTKDLRVA
jgi:hypothetical protein